MESSPKLITTGQLAKALGVAAGTILNWQRAGMIRPSYTTPTGHHRWVLDDVREQIRKRTEDGE